MDSSLLLRVADVHLDSRFVVQVFFRFVTMSSLRNPNLVDILLWLLQRRKRFRVEGISMLPLLQPGDEVLVNRQAYRSSPPSLQDIVVIRHPHRPSLCLIKRVTAIAEHGSCFVQGDNSPQSTDSRSFGWIETNLIIGRVTSRFV